MGRSCFSRSSCLTCFGVSPSISPLRSRPWASRATYSKAPILVLAGDAEHFFQGGFSRHDLAPAVVADAGAGGACVALELLFGRSGVDHGAHVIVDGDELVNAGTAPIAHARLAARAIELHRPVLRIEIEQAPLIFAR